MKNKKKKKKESKSDKIYNREVARVLEEEKAYANEIERAKWEDWTNEQ